MQTEAASGLNLARDVILAAASYADHDSESKRPIQRFETPIRIHGDVWIGELDHELAEAILDACAPRGENFAPYRQYGATYALYKDFPARDRPYEPAFDPNSELSWLYSCHDSFTRQRWGLREVREFAGGRGSGR